MSQEIFHMIGVLYVQLSVDLPLLVLSFVLCVQLSVDLPLLVLSFVLYVQFSVDLPLLVNVQGCVQYGSS
jgi:hypothetical protein